MSMSMCAGTTTVMQARCRTHRQRLLLGHLNALRQDSRVHAFARVALRLLEQLSDEEDDRGRAVASLVILRNCCPCNHRGGRVLRRGTERASEEGDLSAHGAHELRSNKETRHTWICISDRSTLPS